MAYKRDYLRREEILKLLYCIYFKSMLDGNLSCGPIKATGIEYHKELINAGIGGPEEQKYLKFVNTYIDKFIDSQFKRLSDKELKKLLKKIHTSTFSIIEEEFQRTALKKDLININDKVEIDLETWFDMISEIMNFNCRECDKSHSECKYYDLFTQYNIPISDFGIGKCVYAYPSMIKEHIKE